MRRSFLFTAFAIALGVSSSALPATGAKTVTWRDLAPDPATTPWIPGQEPLSKELEGKDIRIEGYLLPVDIEGERVYEFMLVPWVGACSHMPKPPVNQMVLVRPATPYALAEAYEPVAVTGVLKAGVERTQFFLLDGVIELDAGYSIGRAAVEHMDRVAQPVEPGANPWKSITK